MSLSLLVTTANGLLLDPMRPMRDLEFSTGEHGYEALSVFAPMGIQDAFLLYDAPGLPQVFVKWNGITVWQGRLEDRRIVPGGIELGALGDWRGYSDTLLDKSYLVQTAQAIVNDVIDRVNSVNSFMSTAKILVQSTGVTYLVKRYEDKRPAEILQQLAASGDNQTPPRVWEVGVWEDRVLYFRPIGDDARTWHVDVDTLELERTIETLFNSVYTNYQDQAHQRVVTTTATDAASIDRWGLTRRAAINVNTTETARANEARDTFLQDHKDPKPRAAIGFRRLYDPFGVAWPGFAARAHDKFFIRNLPTTLSADIDRIRSFRASATRYRADTDELLVTPEVPLPTLESLNLKPFGVWGDIVFPQEGLPQ